MDTQISVCLITQYILLFPLDFEHLFVRAYMCKDNFHFFLYHESIASVING